METLDFCKKHNACREGVEFASKFQTLSEVWDACPRADWMIWLLQKAKKTGGLERTLRIFACDCAESAKPTDPRSLAAIAVARRYADGLATADELRAARVAAYSADAYADAVASYASYADAATAAEAAAEAAYADDATRKTHAERLRAAIPNPFTKA